MNTWIDRRLLLFLLSTVWLLLPGCGGVDVYPVYSQRPLGLLSLDESINGIPARASASSGLPPMAISLPTGRDGQMLHNALRDRLAPTGLPKAYAYELISQSLHISTQEIQTQVGTSDKLSKIVVEFSYRVNNVDINGDRSLAFADSLVVDQDYVDVSVDSPYVDDARMTRIRNQVIYRMAEAVEISLQLQFSGLNNR